MDKAKQCIYIIAGPLLLICLWQGIRMTHKVNAVLFPSFTIITKSLVLLLYSGQTYQHIISTLLNTLSGFFIAIIIGIPSGLLLGSSKRLQLICMIPIGFFRSLPATAIFPIFLLLFGINNAAKIAISGFISLRIIIVATMSGVQHISRTRKWTLQLLGVSGLQYYKQLFYSGLSHAMIGIKTASAMSLIVVIVTEVFVGTKYGLGQQIYDAYTVYDSPLLFAWIIIAGMLGYSINTIVIKISQKILHWE